ncbi:MAG: hypothetical protein R2712_29000 [Vicinamibacterales bacterium]
MLFNRIVARYADGRVLKGTTQDSRPPPDAFHVIQSEGGGRPVDVIIAELKAVFFVKDLIGNSAYSELEDFSRSGHRSERCGVTFAGAEEVLVGDTRPTSPTGPASSRTRPIRNPTTTASS